MKVPGFAISPFAAHTQLQRVNCYVELRDFDTTPGIYSREPLVTLYSLLHQRSFELDLTGIDKYDVVA